jgi:dephospho-CoA kinase
MLVVGLTGGVGMGKSTVAEVLCGRGEMLIDTDVLAREAVAPGSEALAKIRENFGAGVIALNGFLDRAKLAAEVFEVPERRKLLESIVHPPIREAWRKWVEAIRLEGRERAVVIIPLLFETGAEKELDRTVCVGCSPSVQITRLRARGWSGEHAWKRISAQWPIGQKMDRADGVIWNDSTLEICREQAERLFE